jgi:hypothetical protein
MTEQSVVLQNPDVSMRPNRRSVGRMTCLFLYQRESRQFLEVSGLLRHQKLVPKVDAASNIRCDSDGYSVL